MNGEGNLQCFGRQNQIASNILIYIVPWVTKHLIEVRRWSKAFSLLLNVVFRLCAKGNAYLGRPKLHSIFDIEVKQNLKIRVGTLNVWRIKQLANFCPTFDFPIRYIYIYIYATDVALVVNLSLTSNFTWN